MTLNELRLAGVGATLRYAPPSGDPLGVPPCLINYRGVLPGPAVTPALAVCYPVEGDGGMRCKFTCTPDRLSLPNAADVT